MSRRLKAALLSFAVLTALAGCGQKGPLYLPEEEEEEQSQLQQSPFSIAEQGAAVPRRS